MSPHEAWTGRKPTVGHIRKWGCKVYRHINKKTGHKKLHKKSMKGYLVGYESSGIYRIYHPGSKTFKVSRDIIFSESEFFGIRRIGNSEDVLPSNDADYDDTDHDDADQIDIDDDKCDSGEAEQQSENAAPIIYNEIVVEPPPRTSSEGSSHTEPASSSKPLNRRQRRTIAKAFKAVVKGNWKWPRGFREAMAAEDAEDWKIAIQKEYDSIIKNGTWTLVPRPKDAKVVKSRWVLRIKYSGLYKACFCAKGFIQRWGEDYDETFAPVAKYTSIRTLFALLAGHKNAQVHQMDVNTAFLNSDIEEVVYVKQPEGYEIPGKEDFICLLNKALYGLKQSPRAWFQLIASVLVDFDFQQCDSDPCIFIRTNPRNGERTYIALYVDDLIIAGDNEEDIATIKRRLSERFDMKDLGIARKFLGMEIEYGKDGSIKIHQNQYIQQLPERHGMQDCTRPVTTPMDTSVKLTSTTDSEAPAHSTEYASIVGGLMFVQRARTL